MDAFYAAVEVRDDPMLLGKPLIIGALPNERGVVSTCSYEARKFGVRSAMSIKEAYRRCPDGIYMHPDMRKYKQASDAIHKIWDQYTDLVEYVSLDEGYLDVTGSHHMFGGVHAIARAIKEQTLIENGLTCSVGIGYSMTTAKLASEEKKPDGLFEIPDRAFWFQLVMDRNVRTLYTVGGKTAEKMEAEGILTVRDVLANEQKIIRMFGKHGQWIVALAGGIDERDVTPYNKEEAKSIGREITFQQDTTDTEYLKDTLLLIARALSLKLRFESIYCRTIGIKITYGNMAQITRAKSGEATHHAHDIYRVASALFDAVEKKPIRLIGISLSNFTKESVHQMSLTDIIESNNTQKKYVLETELFNLQKKFGVDIIKTGAELQAEKRLKGDDLP